MGEVSVDNGVLSFDGHFEFRFLDLDNQVFAFQVSWDLNCDVEVSDGLSPFVGESGLLRGFLCAGSLVGNFLFYMRSVGVLSI